jgi:hypothetical protein
MRLIFLVSLLFIATKAVSAQDIQIYCNIVNQPGQSELRVTMNSLNPTELALRSPNEDNFRPMNMTIENIIGDFSSTEHTFAAKPNVTSDMIDWENEARCFTEVGSQWYFHFNYVSQFYYVQIMPFYVVNENLTDEICVTPRVPPQTKQLDCSDQSAL